MSPVKALKWTAAIACVAAVVGSAAALFLWSLDAATRQRFASPWLIFLLPLAGAAMGFYYRYLGQNVSSGNHTILAALHRKEKPIPPFLAPSIFIATITTHLFGGSAGREGTAVQMGAAIGSLFGGFLATTRQARKILLFCGISAGFGSVFGTPFAGAVFALEFTGHRILSRKLLPCLLTAVFADYICLAWGMAHTSYPEISFSHSLTTWFPIFWKLIFAAAVLALTSRFYIFASNHAAERLRKWFPHEAIRAAAGGCIVLFLLFLAGTSDFLGLGILPEHAGSVTLPRIFSTEIDVPASTWIWKLLFTVATLGAGFKGGEVTPLLFIGAALGNSIAWFLDAPVDLFAGVSMIAFFAASTKTPFASIIMGIELLGWNIYAPLAVCTMLTHRLSGKKSVYPDPH